MPTCLKTKTPRKPYTDCAGTGCHINTDPGKDAILNLKDKASTRTNLAVSNPRWDTAAGREA